VRLIIKNIAFALETVYSIREGGNSKTRLLTVKYIVKNEALGRLQLDGRTHDTTNIFMNLADLQNMLGVNNEINTILISADGDEYSGLDNEETAINTLKLNLDNQIGYEEMGYELRLDNDQYLRLLNKDVFFNNFIFNLLSTYKQTGPEFVASPVMSYFVNSITLNRTNSQVNYSTVTGLDFNSDNPFGDFDIIEPLAASQAGLNIELANDEMILIDWAAEQLGARIGDKVIVEYMALDRLYNLYNTTTEFTIKYIINFTGKAIDPNLMPDIPGLQGTSDCSDWDPPFPVNLSCVTVPDREYWIQHQGTPKAYINLVQAQNLWSTNLGPYTMIKLNTTANSNEDMGSLKNRIGSYLDSAIGQSDTGFNINQVKSDALETTRGMAIFPMMFLTFGSAIILAGMALIVTIFLILADARKYQLGLGRALGLRKTQIVKLFMLEGLFYSIIAGVIGVLFGLFLGWILVASLNSIWASAVEGYTVPFYFKPISLLIAFLAGFILTLITILFTARHIAKLNIISALHSQPNPAHATKRGMLGLGFLFFVLGLILLIVNFSQSLESFESAGYFLNLFAPVLILFGIGFIGGYTTKRVKTKRAIISITTFIALIFIIIFAIRSFPNSDSPTVELFFTTGLLLLFGIVIITMINISELSRGISRFFGLGRKPAPVATYALQNPTRHSGRTAQILAIFTLVIFIITALSINIAIQQESINVISYEQRGGYDVIGESAVPISIDLENSSQRAKYKINAPVLNNVSVTEIKMVGPPGGTCSNMNVRYPPRLLGVDHEFVMENSFRFMEPSANSKSARSIWLELEKNKNDNNDNNRIPIIVDYNTLVWIYTGAMGEIYSIEDELGKTIDLEVIGVLENSVFGGTFIMSQDNLEELFPSTAEYRYVLFKIEPGIEATPEHIANELEQQLRVFGMDAQSIRELIHENQDYEQSFMVLFQAFLGLGLIIGIIGLGVVTVRAVQERRFEIGVLRALGFNRRMVMKAFLIEPSFTGLIAILIGMFVGIISSYLAFGAWTGGNFEFVLPWFELVFFALILYLVIILSAIYPAYRASKIPPAEALRRVT
jgi:putative ABC transport system permease protein